MTAPLRLTLIPHPDSPPSPVTRLVVDVAREHGRLWFRFVCEGDVDRVEWPGPAAAERSDGLWAHTCFEVFVRTPDGYREFNLSPSGQWAAYRFDDYRQGMAPASETATVSGLDGGEGLVALEGLIDPPPDPGLVGLSAVIEDVDGRISYWALAHPPGKPDFHHPDCFVLDLP